MGRTNWAMAVSNAAKGGRAKEFTADELIAFAQALQVAILALFIPPPDTTVALPGGGPTLDLSAIRRIAYERTELPPPKSKEEARLQDRCSGIPSPFFLRNWASSPGSLREASVPQRCPSLPKSMPRWSSTRSSAAKLPGKKIVNQKTGVVNC